MALSLLPATAVIAYASVARADESDAFGPWWKRIEMHGGVDVYDTLNTNRPGDGRNFFAKVGGTAARANEVGLGLGWLGVRLPRKPAGFNFTLQVGSQADIVHANEPEGEGVGRDLWRFVQRASVEFELGIGRGLEFEIGIMPSHVGFERFTSPSNGNYTRSYLAELSPNYQTGLKLRYPFTEHYSVSAFVVNGWKLIADNNDSKTYGVQAALEGDGGLLALNGLAGREKPNNDDDWRLFADVVAQVKLLSWLTLTATADLGVEQDRALGHSVWVGAAGYVRVALTPGLAFTLRGEYFDDADGAVSGVAQRLGEGTFTVELKPLTALTLKLEARHDRSTAPVFGSGPEDADGEVARIKTQTLVVLGAVVLF